MTTVLLILHLMIASALVGVVLLQRSEGGALGIGGGGGFMTGRGAANFLTRVTAGLAIAFFATSMVLTLLASRNALPPDFTRIIKLIEDGQIDTRPWITHHAKFEDLIAVFPSWLKPETGVIKAMVAVG